MSDLVSVRDRERESHGMSIVGEQIALLDTLSPVDCAALFDAYADGEMLRDVMRLATEQVGYRIHSRGFFAWVRATPARRGEWLEAQQIRAEVLVEQTLEIADDTIPMAENISKAALRAKTRQWVAGKAHPERFGVRAEATVNIGQLHLVAAEAINAADTAGRGRERGPAPPQDAEYEVLAGDPDIEELL